MRAILLRASLLLAVSASPAAAQIGAFDWQLAGNPVGSGFATQSLLHVDGPDGGDCSVHATWFETVLPVGGTISVLVDFQNLDSWIYKGQAWYDAPTWVIDGVWFKPPESGQYPPGPAGWPTGPYELEFDAEAGQRVGLGVWSMDCWAGPGVADFHDLVFTPKPLSVHPAALDARELWEGPAATAIVCVGDTNGDGLSDLAIPGSNMVYGQTARFLSGADGSTLLTVAVPGIYNTKVFAAPGDLDGDGAADVAIGLPDESAAGLTWCGRVMVLSGATGAVLLDVKGTVAKEHLGDVMSAAGDVNLDGVPDLAVRAELQDQTKSKVYLLSGATGAKLATASPAQTSHNFGIGLAPAGDATGDGVPDLFVGMSGTSKPLIIVSGSSGLLAAQYAVPEIPFSTPLAAAGDVDGDGIMDVAGGHQFGISGSFAVVSGGSGATLSVVIDGDVGVSIGSSLAAGADVDGDGLPDVVAGAPGAGLGGKIRVHDAASGALGTQVTSNHLQEGLGFRVVLAGDLGGDGLADLVAVTLPQNSALAPRSLAFHRLDRPGPPQLAVAGDPQPSELLTASVTDALPHAAGLLLVGTTLADLPVGGGIVVPWPAALVPLQADGLGSATVSGRWPAGLPAWSTVWMQAWMQDDLAPAGFSATDGVGASQL